MVGKLFRLYPINFPMGKIIARYLICSTYVSQQQSALHFFFFFQISKLHNWTLAKKCYTFIILKNILLARKLNYYGKRILAEIQKWILLKDHLVNFQMGCSFKGPLLAFYKDRFYWATLLPFWIDCTFKEPLCYLSRQYVL